MRGLVRDTRVYRSFGVDSDHYLVASHLSIEKSAIRSYRSQIKRINVARLKDENVQNEFARKLSERFERLPNVSNVEEEWKWFKSAFLGVARECLGLCGSKNDRKKTAWWNDEIKQAVKEKRVKFLLWLQNKCEGTDRAYKECEKRVKVLVKEAKEREWVTFCQDLECAGNR